MIKTKIKYAILVGLLLCKSGSFAASDTTKKLIHETLAKYGISSGGKEVCGTGREPEYNKQTGIVKCKNNAAGDSNNCWDASSRVCKSCPYATVVSQIDFMNCYKIVCPTGWKLIEVMDGKCPKGFKKQKLKNNSCDKGFKAFTDLDATNNYTTQSISCKNIKIK